MKFKVKFQFPTNNEFNELFDSVGWGNRDDEKINTHRENLFLQFQFIMKIKLLEWHVWLVMVHTSLFMML